MSAFHSLQNYFKLIDNHAIFDLTETEDEDEYPEKIVFPYDKFYIIYTHEKTEATNAVFYEEVNSCDDDRLMKLFQLNGGVIYNFKHCEVNNKQHYITDGSTLLCKENQAATAIKIAYPIDSRISNESYQEVLKMSKHMVDSLIGDLLLKFNSSKHRRVEESPKKIKEVNSHPIRLNERPIIRVINTTKVRELYEKSTGNSGIVMPPHPRRAHVRKLNSDWFINKKGQTIEVKGSNVNGWEWKNSKGVMYKIV